MIIGVRAALLLEGLQEVEGGFANYMGVATGYLSAKHRPGFVDTIIAFHLESDNQPSRGAFHVVAKGFDHRFPFEIAGGHWMSVAAFPLLIPVLEEGALQISLTAEGRAIRKPWSYTWQLEFQDPPESLPKEEFDRFLAECHAGADRMKRSLVTRPGPGLKGN